MEALPGYRKVDWWYEAMVREDIWHQWFSNGIVESETMLSRSALAHIYENLKPKTTVDPPKEVRFSFAVLATLASNSRS